MRSVLARSKTIPVIALVFTFLVIQTAAWGLGRGCIACQMAPSVIAAPRNHVPAQSLLYSSDVYQPPIVHPAYRAPTRFPRGDSGGFGIWDCIAQHESRGNWQYNDGEFEGGVNFENSTWLSYKAPGDPPHAYQASPAAQVAAAERDVAANGWHHEFPQTSRMCGM